MIVVLQFISSYYLYAIILNVVLDITAYIVLADTRSSFLTRILCIHNHVTMMLFMIVRLL